MDDFPDIEPGELRPGDDGGFVGPDNNRWSQRPDDPFDPTKGPPKIEGEGKKLSEAPEEERNAIENDNTKKETNDKMKENIKDDAKSDKSEKAWKLMRTCLKLLFAGYLLRDYGSLIYGDTQSQAQGRIFVEIIIVMI